MIAYLPKAYPDELIYSVLARYYNQSGYVSLTYAIEDLYVHRYTVPDTEFINELKLEVVDILTKQMSMEQVIENHTMFPVYARFLPRERKQQAFRELVAMNGNYNNLLAMPKNQRGVGRVLRYCPHCAAEDREQYGETYWHRSHQIQGLDACPVHRCGLNDSCVSMERKSSPTLTAANSIIPAEPEVTTYDHEQGIQLGKYVLEVFTSPMDMSPHTEVGEYLNFKIDSLKYRSSTGARTYIEKMYHDYEEFYKGLSVMALNQMQKVLNGFRWNFYDVCQLAMFEGVSVAELVAIPASAKADMQQALFIQVAEELKLDYELVKLIGEAVLKKHQMNGRVQRKCGAKTHVWNKMDEEMLPAVQEAIHNIYGTGNQRPRRVTVSAVCKEMGVPSKRFDNLPVCKAEILKHQETQKEYWAREIVWAYNCLMADGQQVCWRRIRDMINIRNTDFQNCKQYLWQYTDADTAALISMLL